VAKLALDGCDQTQRGVGIEPVHLDGADVSPTATATCPSVEVADLWTHVVLKYRLVPRVVSATQFAVCFGPYL
jgi:hypothetical protein